VSNPTIQALPRSAEESSRSLELRPSRTTLAICLIWWIAASLAVGWGTELHSVWRLALVAALAGLLFPVIRAVRNSACVLRWRPEGELTLQTVSDRQGIPAALAAGSQRFGRWLVLRLRTRSGCPVYVLDAGTHDPATFRRFLREVCGGAAESV
jgi:hypothetical protein